MGGDAKASEATKAAATEFHAKNPMKVYFYLGALILAYFAKYFCTSFLYVVQSLWRKDQNISRGDLAHQFILGYVMSMIGKRCAGKWADQYGGKKVQMLSLGVYIPVVILWSFGDKISDALGMSEYRFPVYLTMWLFNGFFALGLSWVAIMVCASNWIPPHMEGRLLAVVGCAPELGDSSARAFLGPIIKHGWRREATMLRSTKSIAMVAAMFTVMLQLGQVEAAQSSPKGYKGSCVPQYFPGGYKYCSTQGVFLDSLGSGGTPVDNPSPIFKTTLEDCLWRCKTTRGGCHTITYYQGPAGNSRRCLIYGVGDTCGALRSWTDAQGYNGQTFYCGGGTNTTTTNTSSRMTSTTSTETTETSTTTETYGSATMNGFISTSAHQYGMCASLLTMCSFLQA